MGFAWQKTAIFVEKTDDFLVFPFGTLSRKNPCFSNVLHFKAEEPETIHLIQAENEAKALLKATDLGHSEEHNYPNEHGENVKWSFVCILEIQDLCEDNIFDGMEVFSTLKWSPSNSTERNQTIDAT